MPTTPNANSSVVDLLRDLIAIPSVNPDGDPGTDQTGEQACAEYVAAFLEFCGAEVCLEEVRPGRPNVIGRFPCHTPDPVERLLFAPHLDTVGVGGMTIDPFGAELRDGRIWGRGASDTKGSMAAMLWALWENHDLIPRLEAEILFAGLMSEESRQLGSKHFALHHAGEASFALAGEPTELNCVHAHKACWWLELTTGGKAAHASQPERGDNAILNMQRVIGILNEELPKRLAIFDDPLQGASSFSINQCRGGARANIVPDSCAIVMDVRATPALHEEGVDAVIRDFLNDRGLRDTSLKVISQTPVLDTDKDHPVIGKLCNLGVQRVTAPWFCDAGWLAKGGIPGIAIGPGSIEQAHTEDEWISVADLQAGAEFFGQFLRQWQ